MTLRELLNKNPALRPLKIVFKIIFEKIYGLTGEDRWLKMLADHSVTPVALILDVGSSGGHYLGKAARFFPNAEFHHFEPRPDAADRLSVYTKHLGTKSTIHRVALSDNRGTAQFAVMNYGDASSLIISDTGAMTSVRHVITVSTDRLDNISGIGNDASEPIGLLKIDVEGAEFNVLKGAIAILSRVASVQLEISAMRHVGGHRETLEVFRIVFEAGFNLVDTSESNYLFTRDPGILAIFRGRSSTLTR